MMWSCHQPLTEQLQTILMLEKKTKKTPELIKTVTYDADIAVYTPGVLKLIFQGMLADIETKEKPASVSYQDMEQLDFQILLPGNYYLNPSSIYIFFL